MGLKQSHSPTFERLRSLAQGYQPEWANPRERRERRGKPVLAEAKVSLNFLRLSLLGNNEEIMYPCFPLVNRLEEMESLLWLRGEAWKKAVEQLARAAVNRLEKWLGEKPDTTKRRRQPKGFEGLGQKRTDFSMYIAGARLTDKQRDCFSMKYEYGLGVAEIARRLEKHHSSVQYHLEAAKRKMNHSQARERRARKRARTSVE